MGETRVNLKHLLEDIRDAYPFPMEEAIITELVANSLDSQASKISFWTKPENGNLIVIDNGNGMSDRDFKAYHDIASTTKQRGKGIGFAGVGVKLALLCAENVVTETRRPGFHKATSWNLESNVRAPWEYIEPPGLVPSIEGTAISISLMSRKSILLNQEFIQWVLQKHFYPLLDKEFMRRILKHVYKDGVLFFVNGQKVLAPSTLENRQRSQFVVSLGRKAKPVGIGFLEKSRTDLSEDDRGLAVSTYGKVIKRGWEWTGISPRNPMRLTGVVEVPKLSEILTTSKADFLRDVNSLQKYYRYRKAIQEAVEQILEEFGEVSTAREKVDKDFRPLEREIERVLERMLNDFPELNPLFRRKHKTEKAMGIVPDPDAQEIGSFAEGDDMISGPFNPTGLGEGMDTDDGDSTEEFIDPNLEKVEPGRQQEGKRRRPGLMIGFEEDEKRMELGWLSENTVWINKGHPAFKRCMNTDAEGYHIALSVAWVLTAFLEEGKSPLEFISRFLSGWGERT
jgi:hypothetical protein